MSPVTIPIGPQHPLLKEPLSISLEVEGERIVGASMRIGYVHRGIELLAQDRSYVDNLYLVERICGICSHVHATTYCMAVEALMELDVPPRATYIRVLLCELERIHSHLLWLGVLSEALGFTTIFMYAWRDREIILDLMEHLSGGRVSHAVNVIGGVRIDIDDEQIAMLHEQLNHFREQLSTVRDMLEHDTPFRLRTQGLGHMSLDMVHQHGVVGPMARASECRVDMRSDIGYGAYASLDFEPITASEGDVWARAEVRLQEIFQSLDLCRQVLDRLPEGDISVRAPRRAPAGEVVMRCEAPRGEVFYYVQSDGSDKPKRLKVRTPTLPTLMVLCDLLLGLEVADAAAVIAGADLCIACADR